MLLLASKLTLLQSRYELHSHSWVLSELVPYQAFAFLTFYALLLLVANPSIHSKAFYSQFLVLLL